MAQICKKCLLREMAEADAKMIEKYKEAIKKEDQVSESEYERRLNVCKTCDLLNSGKCLRSVHRYGTVPELRRYFSAYL